MKGSIVAVAAAALAGGASAGRAHRHAHELFHERRGMNGSETCVPGCTTIYTTITGSPGLYTPPPAPETSSPCMTSTSAPAPTTSSAPVTVPTPIPQTCPTPGVYTFTPTTVVLTETTTVCAASSTTLPSGTHTIGGVTTVVVTATTVTCPYATTSTAPGGVVTSVISTTEYVCPTPGTYTIAPVTTTVTESVTEVVIPVVTTYCPGTYTAPAVVTTITETDTVIYCPFDIPTPTSAPAVPTSTAAPAPPQSTPSSSSSSGSGSGSGPKLGGTNGKYAMVYTPYSSSGGCKSSSQVMDDIKEIYNGGFRTVRVYSTDCNTLENVGNAVETLGMKMILGIFIGEPGCENSSPDVADQISAIQNWAKWNLVEVIVVANEAVNNGFCSASQLKSLISHCKSAFSESGYTGPYTTTDVVAAWQNDNMSTVCDVIDFPCANIHAYFDANTLPEQAGTFVNSQLDMVKSVCNTNTAYVMESGWPTEGKCNGKACPGTQEQATALKAIKQQMGDVVAFFTWANDEWKAPGECECERSWGCGTNF